MSESLKIGIVGSTSHLGREFKERLADSGIPGDRVSLLALEESAGILTEYGDEAKVLADAAEDELRRRDVVCFCGEVETARTYGSMAAEAGATVIDGTGAWCDDQKAELTAAEANRLPERDAGAILAVPPGATLLLVSLLRPLDELARGATATVLLPASEAGDAGIDEMAEQAVGALNLDETLPEEIFGRRLAFDVWTAESGRALGSSADEVADQLRRLELDPPALCLLRAGVFHSLSAAMHLPEADEEDVAAALPAQAVEFELAAEEAGAVTDSPVRTAGSTGLRIGALWSEPAGGTWIWALMDNFQARAAAMVGILTAWSEESA